MKKRESFDDESLKMKKKEKVISLKDSKVLFIGPMA